MKKSSHSARQRERIEKLFSAANSALGDARVAFVTLFLLALLLASVASTTTHLDLLLGSKVSLPTQSVEVSRQAMLLIGSLILAGIHFQALRSHLVAAKQLAGLSQLSSNPHALGLELRTNMITDAFFTSVGNRFSRTVSNVLLGSVVLVSPLVTLFFVQLVTLPAHSNLLTGLIRLLLVLDTALTIVAILLFVRYLRGSRVDSHSPRAWLVSGTIAVTLLPAMAGLTVAVFPGEHYERGVVRIANSVFPALVASPDLKTDEKVAFLGLTCRIEDGYRKATEVAEVVRTTDAIYSPETFREPPRAALTKVTPNCRHYGAALTPTVAVMTWLESMTGFSISRTLHLQGQTITGQALPANERTFLSEHSDTQPLHADFFYTLSKVIRVDLSTKDLRFANFDNAFMPRVQLNGDLIYGATFRNANLQGANIASYRTAHNGALTTPGHRMGSPFESADLSAAVLTKPLFLAEAIENTKAIAATFDECRFAGVEIKAGLWQGSTFKHCTFQNYEISKKAHLASRVLSANMAGASFVNTDLHKVFFGSQQGLATSAKLDSSNWIQSRISPGTIFSGVSLRGADFSGTEIGRIAIVKSDVSFAAFRGGADITFSSDSILNPVFIVGGEFESKLSESQKALLLTDAKSAAKICEGSASAEVVCKRLGQTPAEWKSIAESLRTRSCDLAAQFDGFNPDFSNQMVKIFGFGGFVLRQHRDIATIPPTTRGVPSSCGVTLNGKKTAITLLESGRE